MWNKRVKKEAAFIAVTQHSKQKQKNHKETNKKKKLGLENKWTSKLWRYDGKHGNTAYRDNTTTSRGDEDKNAHRLTRGWTIGGDTAETNYSQKGQRKQKWSQSKQDKRFSK